jgi:cephalosporin-C deacetylase-like acetyl esterase
MSNEQQIEEKSVAPESVKTRRAREKLRKQFEDLEKKITPKALEKKSLEIHRWIARHAHHRIVLHTKTISLFDENQNTAKLSQRIVKLSQALSANVNNPQSLISLNQQLDLQEENS